MQSLHKINNFLDKLVVIPSQAHSFCFILPHSDSKNFTSATNWP